ncbi:hypothetical protein ACA910_016374 [Epithemia clementina (nom. ined.)]
MSVLIAVSSFVLMVEANPLHRLLMMRQMPKEEDKGTMSGEMKTNAMEEPEEDVKRECVNLDVDIKALQQEKDRLENELESMTSQWQKAAEDSQRWKEVKEDLVHQMAKVQSQSDKDLSQVREELKLVKSLLDAKEAEFRAMQRKWEQSTNIASELAAKRVHETESLWKKEMEIAKTNAQLDLQNAHRQAEQRCQQQIQQTIDQITNFDPKKKSTTNEELDNNSSSTQNCPTLLGVERVKVKLLEEETSSLETQMAEQNASMQQLIDQMEDQYEAKVHEKERELRKELDEKVRALEEQDACRAALDKATKKHEAQMNKTTEWCNDAMTKLEQEQNINAQSRKRQTELENSLAQLESTIADLNQQQEAEKQRAKRHVQVLNEQHVATVAELNEKHGAAVKKLQEQHEATLKELQEQRGAIVTELMQQHNKTVVELKGEHETALNELKNKIVEIELATDQLKKQHEVTLEQTELQLRTELDTIMNETANALRQEIQAYKNRYNHVKATLEEEVGKNKKILSEHKTTLEQRNAQITQLRRELHSAQQDVEYWEHVFGKRSYFNLTHIQDDAVYWIGEGYRECSSLWKQHVYEPMNSKLEPYRKRTETWYRRHLKKHVDPIEKACVRNYQKYVVPRIQQAQEALQKLVLLIRSECNQGFQSAVAEIRRVCPRLQKHEFVARKSPKFVQTHIREICNTPDQALRQSLITIGFVTAILLRHQIWNLIVQLVLLVWRALRGSVILVARTIWFLSPIRLLIPRKKRGPSKAKPGTNAAATKGSKNTGTSSSANGVGGKTSSRGSNGAKQKEKGLSK